MRTLSVFNNISLDGYFTYAGNDMSWAHGADDADFNAFVAGNASGDGVLVFGRITYDMMAGWWPSDMAAQAMPEVAAGMNAMTKYVFSRSMTSADWQNTQVFNEDAVEALRRLKAEDGAMVVLGSGNLVAQLARAGLVDDYQVVVCPVVLGAGRSMFEGIDRRDLTLTQSRAFSNGKVFLRYKTA
jgi:dihydrofolate reductase